MSNTIKYEMVIGKNRVTIEGEGFKAIMMRAGFLAAIPDKCGNCQSNDLILNGTKNKGYEFYGVKCRSCNHELKCGQRKEDQGLFWKLDDGWVAPYSSQPKANTAPSGEDGKDFDGDDGSDDIPF